MSDALAQIRAEQRQKWEQSQQAKTHNTPRPTKGFVGKGYALGGVPATNKVAISTVWTCVRCDEPNKMIRAFCNNCSAPKGNAIQDSLSSSSSQPNQSSRQQRNAALSSASSSNEPSSASSQRITSAQSSASTAYYGRGSSETSFHNGGKCSTGRHIEEIQTSMHGYQHQLATVPSDLGPLSVVQAKHVEAVKKSWTTQGTCPNIFKYICLQGEKSGGWRVPTAEEKIHIWAFIKSFCIGATHGPSAEAKFGDNITVKFGGKGLYYENGLKRYYVGMPLSCASGKDGVEPDLEPDPASYGLSARRNATRSNTPGASPSLSQVLIAEPWSHSSPPPVRPPAPVSVNASTPDFEVNVVVGGKHGHVLPKYQHYAIDENGPFEERTPFVVSDFAAYLLLLTNRTSSTVAFEILVDGKLIILGNHTKIVDAFSHNFVFAHEEARVPDAEGFTRTESPLEFCRPEGGRERSFVMGRITAKVYGTKLVANRGGQRQPQPQYQDPLVPDPVKALNMVTRSGSARERHVTFQNNEYRPVPEKLEVKADIALLYRHEEVLELIDMLPRDPRPVDDIIRGMPRGNHEVLQRIPIRDLRYTHDTIQRCFNDGRQVRVLINDLCDGRVDLDAWTQEHPLEVVHFEAQWRCLNNRRLYALKQYAVLSGNQGACAYAVVRPANARFHDANTTANDGINVEIR